MNAALLLSGLLFAVAPARAGNEDPARESAKRQTRQQVLSVLPPEQRGAAAASSLAQIAEGLNPSQRQSAASKIKELIPSLKDSPSALGEVGTALAALGQKDDARAVAAQLQRSHPSHPAGFLVEAQAIAKSNPADARRLAARAIGLAQAKGDSLSVGLAGSLMRLTRAESSIRPEDIATGAGQDAGKIRNERLNRAEQQAMAAATQLLSRTQIGEDNILAILPSMSVRRIEGGKDKGISAENVYVEEVNGKKVYVAVLSKQSLEADIQSLAAHFNGKMGRALFLEANDGKVSSLSAKTVEMMQTAWAKAQLLMLDGSKAVACSINSKLCNYVSTLFQAWQGDLSTAQARGAEEEKILMNLRSVKPAQRTDAPTMFQAAAFQAGENWKDRELSFQPWYMKSQTETLTRLKKEDPGYQTQWQTYSSR